MKIAWNEKLIVLATLSICKLTDNAQRSISLLREYAVSQGYCDAGDSSAVAASICMWVEQG